VQILRQQIIAGTTSLTKIPSIEKTDDFIYRFEIKKSTPHVSDDPHLLVFEGGVGPGKGFHSMDVTILRDGQRTKNVELRSFEHFPEPNLTYIKFEFYDASHKISDHDYLLTVILRYLC
jgi:hypothetical protein